MAFASVELPYGIERMLMETVATPDFDSRSNPASIYRAELFIGCYHLRLLGSLLSSFPSTPCSPRLC